MKRMFLTAGMMLAFVVAVAQSNDYIVKTKNAKKANVSGTVEGEDAAKEEEEETAHDFVSKFFKYSSLCDWTKGMKFMVMPEKYDLVVRTFCDASTNSEVSSVSLRHKIMIYQGHTQTADGHAHINFLCADNNKMYYYEVPSGSFEDYCYNKLGVPTLAYLGDVDIAREQLIDKVLFTKARTYRIDTEYDGDGFQEISVPNNQEVKVVAVGVGTRNYPVKIIVEDENGREYYQNVAISKTNCGMRDDEFTADNIKYTFNGSFELQDAIMSVSSDIKSYIGKTVHTKYVTPMMTKGDGKDRTVNVPKMTSFTVEGIQGISGSRYVMMELKELESRREYFKEVTFTNEDVTGDIDGKREDYFGYLFAMGEGVERQTSSAARAAIRQGRVIQGMTGDEVILAMGEEPNQKVAAEGGRTDWIYVRSKGKSLIVHFGRSGKVESYNTTAISSTTNTKSTAKRRTSTAKKTTKKK